MEPFDVVVVGGGPAGVTAALRAAELGARVALVEKGRLGGTCTNDGCVPTRVLAKTARLIRETEHFGTYGLMGDPPSLDFIRLLTYTQGIVQTMHKKKQILQHLRQSGVAVYAEGGAARFQDGHTLLLADGSSIRGEKIIICAGGHARRLPFPGSDAPGVITHHDVWSLAKQPRSVVVLGAAATGCQVASVFSAFGTKVWLLEAAPRILAVEDEAVSRAVTEAFREHGVGVITGIAGVERVEPSGDDGAVKFWYTRQGESRSIDAEAVILAVGWVGNLEELGLSEARVKTDRSYIAVNDQLQTSAPHIFAAGDITGRMMLVQSANLEGRLAAENAVLGEGKSYVHKIVPHGGFTDPEYGGVGLTEAQAKAVEGGCVVATVPYTDLDRAVIDGHAEGFCKLIVSKSSHRILGAHVVGEQAVEVVELAASGMATDMRVEQLADLEIAYPTYTAIMGMAAQQAVRELDASTVATGWRMVGM